MCQLSLSVCQTQESHLDSCYLCYLFQGHISLQKLS
nr:MAG TPA: hypothetical protein [Caudoviricetes sp.]DAT21361.1 MAG TPA: hypothetical protein [Caudoviricetes sp.]